MGRFMWKHNVGPGLNRITVQGELLTAALDGRGDPAVWFIGDRPSFDVTVLVSMTGDAVPEGARHLGTFSPEPGIIAHAWELPA